MEDKTLPKITTDHDLGYADGLRDGADLGIALLNTKVDTLLREIKALQSKPNKMVVRSQR